MDHSRNPYEARMYLLPRTMAGSQGFTQGFSITSLLL